MTQAAVLLSAGLERVRLDMDAPPAVIIEEMVDTIDLYFAARFDDLKVPRGSTIALVALGGYGRKELCPFSDIDVMLLYAGVGRTDLERMSRMLLTPLWDAGLDVGHGVRSRGQCRELLRDDPCFALSLLDARVLAGEGMLLQDVLEKGARHLSPGHILPWLRAQRTARHARHGDGTLLVEPELKNGKGGLRDGQEALWLDHLFRGGKPAAQSAAALQWTEEERGRLGEAYGFALAARCGLHLAAGRKNDRLFLDLQPRVAARMQGIRRAEVPEVERFLTGLNEAMTTLKAFNEGIWQSEEECPAEYRRSIFAAARLRCSDTSPEEEPLDVAGWISLFEATAETGIAPDWKHRRAAETFFRADQARAFLTKEILERVLQLAFLPFGAQALQLMLEYGALGAILPEFGRKQHFVQFDAYHVSPLGAHALQTLVKLVGLRNEGGLYEEIWTRVKDPMSLACAALLHDLGKGEADHAKAGADLSRRILIRFGSGEAFSSTVALLIEHHLLLFNMALHEDLSDESAARKTAMLVGSASNLDMLLLLSVADAASTGPSAWNGWREALLREFYFQVHRVLTRGPLSSPDAAQRVLAARDGFRVLAGKTTPGEETEVFLREMPARYALTQEPRRMLRHLVLFRELETAAGREHQRVPGGRGGMGLVVFETGEVLPGNFRRLHAAAHQQEGIFRTLCGVLALFDVNICRAQLFTWADGKMLCVLEAGNLPEMEAEQDFLMRIRASVKSAMTGRLALAYRLEEHRKSPLRTRRKGATFAPQVEVAAGESDYPYRIRIVADDYPGLLYDLLGCLEECGLEVQHMVAATRGDQAADTFFAKGRGESSADAETLSTALFYLLQARCVA